MNNKKLIDAKLIKEKDSYYLDLTYEYEDDKGIYHEHIPRVYLPIHRYLGMHTSTNHILPVTVLDFGMGVELTVCPHIDEDGDRYKFTIKTVEEKVQKLTVSEIEKRLGYKIEIVAEGES